MFNVFVMRKVSALLLSGVLSTVLFAVGNIYYGLWGGVGFFLGGLLLSYLLGGVLLKNPFSVMLEGKGILAFKLDSTGILQPFIVNVFPPFIVGKLFGEEIKDVFDRDAVYSLAPPRLNSRFAVPIAGGVRVDLDEEYLNDARFSMFHYPVILYNDQLKSVITKSELSKTEKNTFAVHSVLYINRQLESLTFAIRDFGRYIVETMKPKQDFFKSKWVWVILIIGIAIIAAMFAPHIFNAIRGAASNAGTVLPGAGGATITPMGG